MPLLTPCLRNARAQKGSRQDPRGVVLSSDSGRGVVGNQLGQGVTFLGKSEDRKSEIGTGSE